MPARKRRGTKESPWSDEHRARIKTSMIVNRLSDHVAGKVDLSPSQVTAGLGLLRKAIPDLAAVTHSGEIGVKDARSLTDEQLAAIASGSGAGTTDEEESPRVTH